MQDLDAVLEAKLLEAVKDATDRLSDEDHAACIREMETNPEAPRIDRKPDGTIGVFFGELCVLRTHVLSLTKPKHVFTN